jgi:hypothetical protein
LAGVVQVIALKPPDVVRVGLVQAVPPRVTEDTVIGSVAVLGILVMMVRVSPPVELRVAGEIEEIVGVM